MARYRPKTSARLPIIFRNLRQDAGYNQAQFAALVGVSDATISCVEAGLRRPSQAVLNAYGELARQMQNR